ncbi:MAG TPA: hypothetical protein VN654_31245 [Vicinamibacterales bacterium]|jgi:hypothetical protein|nr:hypothetical protein [Vicinamibacterales bacterium]
MSRSIGDTLPHNVLERLNGRNLDAVSDRVLVVCSVDDRGFPHPALLSYFETIAIDARTIRLAMYANSRSVQNARREGRLTLVLVEDRVAYYIKGHVRELSRSMPDAPHNAKLHFEVAEVMADEPDPESERGACITSGITCVNPRDDAAMHLARQILAQLAE